MIFKINTDDLGKTKLSVNNTFKDLFNGNLFKKQNIISETDLKCLNAYNVEIKNGVSPMTAYYRTMQTASDSAVNMARSAGNATVNLEQIPKVSKAAELGLKTLSAAGNMLAEWAFSQVITLIHDCATASDRLEESASDLGEQFSSTKSDIEGYKSKITDLYKIINDSSSSYEDTYNARQELLTIQDEMIEKFGSEADAVQLVTSAINGQTQAFDDLTKDKWQETVNKFIIGSDKKWTERIGDSWANLWSGTSNNFDRMIKEMEDAEISFRVIPGYDNNGAYEEFSNKLKEIFGAEITHTERDDIFTLSGDLNSIYNQLLNIQSLASNLGIDNSFLPDLARQADEVKNTLESYQEIYNQHILYDKIFDNDDYEQSFKDINEKYKEYQEAFASGNENAIEKAKQSFAEIVQDATEGISDQSVIDYFNSMYPDLQEVVGGWKFEVKYNTAINDNNDDFENEVKEKLSHFYTSDQILNFRSETATQEQIAAYTELCEISDEYRLTLDQLIAKLEQLGLISSNIDKDMQNSIRQITDNYGISDREETTELELYTKDFTNPQKELWLEATQGAKNAAQAIEMYEAKLPEIGDAAIEPPISLSIPQTVDQLNTQIKPAFDSLHSAWQEIFTDDGFALNNINILSTCDSIKSKLDEMVEMGLDIDYSAFEDFVRILNNAESTEEDVEYAFDSLATSITNAGLSGAEDFETMKAALEDLGVANNEMVAFDALVKNTTALEEALNKAGLTMDDFMISTEGGVAVASETAQAFISEMVGAENLEQALALLQLRQLLCNENGLDTSDDINACYLLAQTAGIASGAIAELAGLDAAYKKESEAGNTQAALDIAAQMEKVKQKVQDEFADLSNVKVNWNSIGGGTKPAAGAGKSAVEAYIDAFEEELSDLGELRDNGVITEKEYLDQLRALYEKHFQNKLGYEKEYAKYQRQYLEGYKSLYESALSGISKLLRNQIDGYNDAKDAAVATLTDEKEARLAVIDAQKEQLEAQKDLIDEQIDAKQKLIDDIQDEIDAMKEANDERQRQLDLQKAQYELERMQHQRTILQYSEEGGMQYVQDDDGLRAAKENVDNARFEIEISNKEKNIALLEDEISLLEEQKDAIQDQMDILDKQAEQIENYYSKMITETESYYDTLISNMEKQKSKWEEIAEIESVAKAYSDLEQVAGGMGYTVQDLLSGNEQAFEDFKSRYISLLSDLNNNSSFSEGLSYATSGISESINNLEASAATVNESTGSIAANIEDVNTSAEALSGSLSNINHALSGFSETDNITAAADAFSRLGQAIQSVANALNISEDGTIGNLADALQSLCEMPLCETESNGKAGGFLSKFQALKNAVSDVTSAISGGGSSTSSGTDASASSSPGMNSGANAGSSGSLTGAIESLKSAANEALGSGNSKKSKNQTGGSGIISQFGQLKNAVTDTTAAIGNGDSAQGEQTDDPAGGGTLISSISDLGTATTEILTGGGDNDDKAGGVIGRFEQFKDVIGKANDHVTGIKDGLTDIDGETVECTIKVNIEQNGELPSYAQSALGHMKLESAEYHAKHGSALAKGTGKNRGLSHTEKNALRSEYGQPELTVYPNGTTELTTQPTISDLPKGTVVFNEAQTKKIFRNKPDSMGKTYTDGSIGQNAGGNLTLPPAQRPSFLVQQELQEECFSKTGGIVDKIVSPVNMISHHMKEMTGLLRNMNQINHNGQNQSVNIGDVNINCPGITSQEVARQVGDQLNHIFSGFHNYADQQSRIR